jgi:regulator of protease activity HflC (stomatin/prohibitin superfamily)
MGAGRADYRRSIQPGLNVLVPFIDRVRTIVDLREQEVRVSALSAITADRSPVSVGVRLRYQITDPRAATYEIADVVPVWRRSPRRCCATWSAA